MACMLCTLDAAASVMTSFIFYFNCSVRIVSDLYLIHILYNKNSARLLLVFGLTSLYSGEWVFSPLN